MLIVCMMNPQRDKVVLVLGQGRTGGLNNNMSMSFIVVLKWDLKKD